MIHEECGVFGVWLPQSGPAAHYTYAGLFALQHRGQEAAGIAVSSRGVFRHHKDSGLVGDVFSGDVLSGLGEGNISVGHVRYSTSGNPGRENAQPIVVQHRKGNLALCHNGNLTNSAQLREELELKGCIFHTTSDTEVISYVLTRERLRSDSIEEALEKTMETIEGAYSLVMMSPTKLLAARDPRGFRPLCIGRLPDGGLVVASESCALDAAGAKFLRDIDPGEILVISRSGIRSIRSHCGTREKSLCVFEYIYFARPDSVIDGCPVHEARRRAGHYLARSHPVQADVVIGVPDSGLDAAVGYSEESGIPYDIGLVKNKYIGRTFIAPSQEQREQMVRLKLNTIRHVVEGRRVVLVDDSIVRGTTSAQFVRLVREAGAKEVHLRISAPPFLHACYYGTDIDSEEHLIAVHHTVEETASLIGADSLGYLSVEEAKHLNDMTGNSAAELTFANEKQLNDMTGNSAAELTFANAKQLNDMTENSAAGLYFANAKRLNDMTGNPSSHGVRKNDTADQMRGTCQSFQDSETGTNVKNRTCGLCTACFDGQYPTAIPSVTCKNRFEIPLAESGE